MLQIELGWAKARYKNLAHGPWLLSSPNQTPSQIWVARPSPHQQNCISNSKYWSKMGQIWSKLVSRGQLGQPEPDLGQKREAQTRLGPEKSGQTQH